MTLTLEYYLHEIDLYKDYKNSKKIKSQDEINLIMERILKILLTENGVTDPVTSLSLSDKRAKIRSLLTIRPALPLTDVLMEDLDTLFYFESASKNNTNAMSLPVISEEIETQYSAADRCSLWKGDITSLKADTIVNAANEDMLGCFAPFHNCIDNAIHSVAGPRLRDDCNKIISMQGHKEKTGDAKITRAYHLPSRYVIHTVGPVFKGPFELIKMNSQLADCYKSCLNLCKETGDIDSIAFCSISTGVFGFPKEAAAKIALETVSEWFEKNNSSIRVIFNVFSDSDYDLYRNLLSGRT